MSYTSKRYGLGLFIVALGALFYCYEYFLRVAPGVMEPQLMSYFHIDATLFGTLSGFYFYAYTPMQLFVGMIVDRFRARIVIMIAILACAVGTFLLASTPHYDVAALGRFLQGFGSAFAFVGALKLASIWLPSDKFAFAAGSAGALGFLGAGASQIYLDKMLQHYSWQHTIQGFTLLGAVLIVLVAITFLFKKPTTVRHRHPAHPPSIKRSVMYFVDVLKVKRIWLAGLFAALMFLPTSVFAALWGIPYLEILHHYSSFDATIATSMIFFGWALGSAFTGWLSDYFQHRVWIMRIGALIACALSFPLLYVANMPLWLVCVLFVVFGTASAVEALSFVVARDLSPSKYTAGTAIAFINFLTMMGGLLFQRGVGQILDWDWSGKIINGIRIYNLMDYEHAMIIVPASLVLAFIVSLFIKDSLAHPE